MASSIEVVESVENDIELAEPSHVELRIFDVGVVGFELDVWVELLGDFLRNLGIVSNMFNVMLRRK